MKLNLFLCLLLLTMVLVLWSCKKDTEQSTIASLHGVITDKATGEPIKSAGVQMNPSGIKTVTGSEGQYEFTELQAGAYSLQVIKTGYIELAEYKIHVEAGKANKVDVQIEKLPPSLRVVDNTNNNIDILDFGAANDDLSRSFNIFNDGENKLDWQITKTSEWINNISKVSGILDAGATQSIVITIDRSKLPLVANTTTIQITSNNGSKALTVKVTNNRALPVCNTLDVTNVNGSSVTFNGKIVNAGDPVYIERGFVYAISSMPTLENTITKLTATVTDNVNFAANISGLIFDKTYYIRAYAQNKDGVTYSTNEVKFTPAMTFAIVKTQATTNVTETTATFNGTIEDIGDPAYFERGFVYSINSNPTIDTKKEVSGIGTKGSFGLGITGLLPDQKYYVRAYSINNKGTIYGNEVDFTTSKSDVIFVTSDVTNRGASSATFNATITNDGLPSYKERGFCYSKNSNPTITDSKHWVEGKGIGNFSKDIAGLEYETTYYVRAYVIQGVSVVYSNTVKFTTTWIDAEVVTTGSTNIKIASTTFNATITNEGAPLYHEKGFCVMDKSYEEREFN